MLVCYRCAGDVFAGLLSGAQVSAGASTGCARRSLLCSTVTEPTVLKSAGSIPSLAKYDLAVVGAGIVGLAVAREYLRRRPGSSLIVIDKQDTVGFHQTGHNSGVIHAGVYYKPGSLKARLCVEGAAAMVDFCRRHHLPHKVCGKLIVATREEELPRLDELARRGAANGLGGLRRLDGEEMREV